MVPQPKKILIAGCGAIGSVFGCLLQAAGHEVALLGREWHLIAIRSAGLRVDGLWGNHHAQDFRLGTRTSDIADRYDIIFISVKAHATVNIVRKVHPFLKPEGLAISLQNGLGNIESLAEHFGPSRSLAASILVGAIISQPGQVTVTVQAAPIIVGPLDLTASLDPTQRLVEMLSAAGIPCEATDQILSHVWAKVFYNAPLNPLGALLRVHYGILGEQPELRALMDNIIAEAFAVAQKQNVNVFWESAQKYRDLFYARLLPATYRHQSSMLQDLERGRRTEIDALNGKIWQYGESLGIRTPFNEIMTRLIWAREKRSGI